MKKLNNNDTILAFGDSITYGFGVGVNNSYPKILAKKINTNIINAGMNGDTTSNALKRLPALLNDNSIKLMFLCLGSNDLLQNIANNDIKENLKKIIKTVKNKNISILLILPNFSLFGPKRLALYKELAEEENIELIEDLLSEVSFIPSFMQDDIHPSAHGYEYIADTLYRYLKNHDKVALK